MTQTKDMGPGPPLGPVMIGPELKRSLEIAEIALHSLKRPIGLVYLLRAQSHIRGLQYQLAVEEFFLAPGVGLGK